jgi:hypothetical protein
MQNSQDLVPGGHYILYTGTNSMIMDAPKSRVLNLRSTYGEWIHLADDVLDAPDLPPSDFKRR